MRLQLITGIVGAGLLAGCNALPMSDIVSSNNGTRLESYFATSVGKVAGHAKALGSACPSLTFQQDELDLHRISICRGSGKSDDCTVPDLEPSLQKSFRQTMASLKGLSSADICTKAKNEIAVDAVLAEYLK